jgi:hypothetical protein
MASISIWGFEVDERQLANGGKRISVFSESVSRFNVVSISCSEPL